VLFLEPRRRLRVFCDLGLEPLLAVDLTVEHPLGQRPVLRRNSIDQHQIRETVAPIVEAPAVHARQQPAIGMPPLVEFRRSSARDRDLFRWRLDQIVGQAAVLIGHGIAVELGPSLVVV